MATTSLSRTDFPNICRTCLSTKENMASIFVPEVLEIIHLCTDIQITDNDLLPNLICMECTEQVQQSFSFRQRCNSSEEILQRIILEEGATQLLQSSNLCIATTKYDLKTELDVTNSSTNSIGVDEHSVLTIEDQDAADIYVQSSSTEDSLPEALRAHGQDDYRDNLTDGKLNDTNCHMVVCNLCKKKMPEGALFGHLRRHKQTKKHTCDQCPKAYREPCELAKHRASAHYATDTLQCDVCNKVFQLQAQLDFHLRSHFKKKYVCDVCDKEFLKSTKLKRHKETHEKREKTFFCLHCESTFMRDESLKLHHRKYHSDKPHEKQICNICGKAVFNIRTHFLHKHTNDKPHKCDQCERAFPFKSTLTKHINEKHLKIKQELKALCSVCGKACPSQGDLKKHQRIHIEDRQHDCHLCERKYKSLDGLRGHLKVHANLRPYVCTFCPKAFHTNTILKNHLRTHTGERPFACHICGRAFAQKVALTTHMKVHD